MMRRGKTLNFSRRFFFPTSYICNTDMLKCVVEADEWKVYRPLMSVEMFAETLSCNLLLLRGAQGPEMKSPSITGVISQWPPSGVTPTWVHQSRSHSNIAVAGAHISHSRSKQNLKFDQLDLCTPQYPRYFDIILSSDRNKLFTAECRCLWAVSLIIPLFPVFLLFSSFSPLLLIVCAIERL